MGRGRWSETTVDRRDSPGSSVSLVPKFGLGHMSVRSQLLKPTSHGPRLPLLTTQPGLERKEDKTGRATRGPHVDQGPQRPTPSERSRGDVRGSSNLPTKERLGERHFDSDEGKVRRQQGRRTVYKDYRSKKEGPSQSPVDV